MRSIVTCAVLSGDPPMTTQWLKDGGEIPLDLEPKIELIDEYTTYLKFKAVGPHHNGNYTCIAKNPAATVNFTALLVVNVPPYWRSQPTDRSAVMGESLTVDCQANGFPVPQVRWKKDHGWNVWYEKGSRKRGDPGVRHNIKNVEGIGNKPIFQMESFSVRDTDVTPFISG
ncbi:down syndrome cell adhesion molecule-like protein Dscam2 [Caerostris darwini]|uniref:Down syndrome cell adhesion molecule-like protein Dscam2 n=1 Tax=Caerostris darwini TaxID=1538125 RepID=A0AAV4QVB1_9ARAC|nr:down syndrome cell adhesion molecule-like protein Dscam2 [Caerostris darwini]